MYHWDRALHEHKMYVICVRDMIRTHYFAHVFWRVGTRNADVRLVFDEFLVVVGGDWMGRSLLRKFWHNFLGRSYLRVFHSWASTTWKQLVGHCNWTARVPMVRWNYTKTTPKPPELKHVFTENLEAHMNGCIPANKYDRERTNRSQDPVKEPNELSPQTGWTWCILQPPQALHRGGDQLITGGRDQTGTNGDFFLKKKKFLPARGFVCRQCRFFVTDGRCRAYSAQNAACALTHTWIFLVWLKSCHRLRLCLVKKWSSSFACHVWFTRIVSWRLTSTRCSSSTCTSLFLYTNILWENYNLAIRDTSDFLVLWLSSTLLHVMNPTVS